MYRMQSARRWASASTAGRRGQFLGVQGLKADAAPRTARAPLPCARNGQGPGSPGGCVDRCRSAWRLGLPSGDRGREVHLAMGAVQCSLSPPRYLQQIRSQGTDFPGLEYSSDAKFMAEASDCHRGGSTRSSSRTRRERAGRDGCHGEGLRTLVGAKRFAPATDRPYPAYPGRLRSMSALLPAPAARGRRRTSGRIVCPGYDSGAPPRPNGARC